MLDELLRAHSDLRTRPRAPKRNVAHVGNWFCNNDGAIMEEERRSISHKEDLISIAYAQKPTMRQFLESHIIFRLCWFWRKKPPPEMRECYKETRFYSSDERIDCYTTIAIFVTGLLMLIAPLWTMNVISRPYLKLGVITIFIVMFLSIVYYGTAAKPFETLAAIAA